MTEMPKKTHAQMPKKTHAQMPKKTPAQIEREIQEALNKKGKLSFSDDLRRRHLEDAIESVYDRKGSEDLTEAEVCEAVREMLSGSWSIRDTSDKAIGAMIRAQIPNWF
jgi:hypothetical protein